MKLGIAPRRVFKPSFIAMLAVLASLAAWLFPSFGVLNKGFQNASRLNCYNVIVLLCWYLLIFSAFTIGQKVGDLFTPWIARHPLPRVLHLDSKPMYLAFTLLAAAGLGTMLQIILSNMTVTQAILFVSLGQTNALKDSIYEDYHIGLVSFRYVVLYPGSLALYRIIRHRQYSLLNLLNVLMLAASAFLSSRLILIAALVTTMFLVTFQQQTVRLRLLRLSMVAASVFLVLSVLNISRNAAYYERNKLSFGLAGLNEIVAYLGTPFQVALGSVAIADDLGAEGLKDPTHQTEPYRSYVDIGVNYNTNSAYVALHEKMGYWAWPYVAVLCGCMGLFFVALRSMGTTYFLLPCGAILYAAGELWRLDLFEQGMFFIWMMSGVGLPAALLLGKTLWTCCTRIYKSETEHPNQPSSCRAG